MKIIRCTQKLIKKLKVEPAENLWAKSWLESWHANIFTIEDEECLLVTNDATLYSLFLCGLGEEQFNHIHFIINEYFFKLMFNDTIPQPLLEKALNVGDDVLFTKSANKSVMGSMNDMKQTIEAVVMANGGLNGGGALQAQKSINRTPMKAINFQYPIDAFITKLEKE